MNNDRNFFGWIMFNGGVACGLCMDAFDSCKVAGASWIIGTAFISVACFLATRMLAVIFRRR